MNRRTRILVIALLGAISFAPSGATAKDESPPRAAQVIARGSKNLAGALAIALGPAGAARPVALVVDVTENTLKRAAQIEAALIALDVKTTGHWQIGRLGDRLGAPAASARDLARQVRGAMGKQTPAVSTVKALRRSLKNAPQDAVIVYLADWRFEDDTGLKDLVGALRRGKRTLSVVGSEAAFGRAWNDGVREPMDRQKPDSMERLLYLEGIGRSPFGPVDHKAPWHGGDTAYPAVPYRFAHRWWQSEFSPSEQLPKMEDLKKRLPNFVVKQGGASSSSGTFRTAPLPSAFGPYGLMRACGATGGRYVLWSWNPSGRASVQYDFGRCNFFGPDLRSRSAIHASLPKLKLARAMVRAWHAMLDVDGELIEITAPLAKNAKTPQTMEVLEPSGSFVFTWRDRQAWKTFVRVAGYAVESLDDAAKGLDTALEKTDAEALPTRRYEADAHLLRHIVRVVRFEVNEALTLARQVTKDAWNDETTNPAIVPKTWIQTGLDPDAIKTTDAKIQDEPGGTAVREAREHMLRRYKGTPFGAQVGLNTVNTFSLTRARKMEPGKGLRTGRSPAESSGTSPKTPDRPETPPRGGPAGGSGGGGPATGGG